MSEEQTISAVLEVRRGDLSATRVVPALTADDAASAGEPELAEGEALLRVDQFALTANNVTYGVFGEAMKYFEFFPSEDKGWGRPPAWGFADVTRSRAEGLAEGERIYGFVPMATEFVVVPQRTSELGFTDGAPHRKVLHGVYNQYVRTAADPAYKTGSEDEQALLRPLFATSFLIADALADRGFHGAGAVALSSASSKTAYGTAFMLGDHEVEVIGLTSQANAGFAEALGCYDRVLTYEEAGELSNLGANVAYVDMSGDAGLRKAIHEQLIDSLVLDMVVGATHHDRVEGLPGLPGPAPTMFFAPARVKERSADWGPEALQKRLGEASARFIDFVRRDDGVERLSVVHAAGPVAVAQTWQALVAGDVRPQEGHVLSMHERG